MVTKNYHRLPTSFEDGDAPALNWSALYQTRFGEHHVEFVNHVRAVLALAPLPVVK